MAVRLRCTSASRLKSRRIMHRRPQLLLGLLGFTLMLCAYPKASLEYTRWSISTAENHIDIRNGLAGTADSDKGIRSQVQPCGSEKTILLYVYTARDNWIDRSRVRKTYGKVKQYCGVTLRTVFFVGAPFIKAENLQLLDDYGDIVIDSTYTDTYRNLTAKGLSALRWASQFCANAIAYVKIDDDAVLDPYRLVEMILTIPPKYQNKLLCQTSIGGEVIRVETSKYYLSKKDYEHDTFPPYCAGFGYIWPANGTIEKILQVSKSISALAMEDVYLTGVLADKIGLQHFNMIGYYTMVLHGMGYESKALLADNWVMVGEVGDEFLYTQFWNLILNREKQCRP